MSDKTDHTSKLDERLARIVDSHAGAQIDNSEPPTCECCGDVYTMETGDEPTPFCDRCAHDVLEKQTAELTEARATIATLTHRADVLTAELRRLYAAVCHGQTRSDDARAIAQAVIDEYIQTAEQCDRNDTLRDDRDAARFLRAGWRRLAEDKRDDAWAWMRAHNEAALARDAALANAEAVLLTADAMRADIARAAAVVEAAREVDAKARHQDDCADACRCGLESLQSALDALDKYEEW